MSRPPHVPQQRRHDFCRWFKAIATTVIIAMLASCATVPGRPEQPIFPTFEWCFGVNVAAAAVGGAAIAILMQKLLGRQDAAIGSGIATAAALSIVAWHQCARAHSKTTTVMQRSRDEVIAERRLAPDPVSTLVFDEFGARVDQNAKLVTFDLGFVFIADSRDDKDIPITIRHKLDIVQMVRRNDKLVLADAAKNPLVGENGQPIPVTAFASAPEGKIAYQTFYDKPDREIIQQGSRKITHELPAAIKNIEYPLPLRYTVVVEAGRFSGEQMIEFYLPDVSDRPKTFAAKRAAVVTAKDGRPPGPLDFTTGQSTPSAENVRPQPATPTPRAIEPPTQPPVAAPAQFVTQKIVQVYESAGSPKQVGRLQANTLLQVHEVSELTLPGARPAIWLKVSTKQGLSGWVRKGDVVELK